MLNWCKRFNICSFLDSHQYNQLPSTIDCVAAVGAVDQVPGQDLEQLQSFIDQHQGKWLFGHLAYNCKDQIEALQSRHTDPIGFPALFFFVPAIVLQLQQGQLIITTYQNEDPVKIYNEIANTPISPSQGLAPIQVSARMSPEAYLTAILRLKEHIQRGDCYEINFCQEFFSERVQIDPINTYLELTRVSPTPFACYYHLHEQHLLCASPERYLQKKGRKLISQPIKGTIKRIPGEIKADLAQIEALRNSEKDKSENVMVVDLVRNDLSKICKQGSVQVSELFGIYSFPQVHQMISTVEGELDEQVSFTDIIRASFPMGSMTGAPKLKVMELIEQYEHSHRGLYSGAVGYIDPSGNFDLNVVIRSIQYNALTGYLNYQVGGGITYYSDPAREYEECLLKAAAIRRVLGEGKEL